MQGDELDRLLSYWREQLRGAPAAGLRLPTGRPQANPPVHPGRAVATTYGRWPRRPSAWAAGGARAPMPPCSWCFSPASVATLSRYARQADMLLGTQVTDRTHTELDPLVGMFHKYSCAAYSRWPAIRPLASCLGPGSGTPPWTGLAHKQLPFEKLVAELAPDRTLAARTAHPGSSSDCESLTPPTLGASWYHQRAPWCWSPRPRKLDLAVFRGCPRCPGHQTFDGIQAPTFSMRHGADRFLGCIGDPCWNTQRTLLALR